MEAGGGSGMGKWLMARPGKRREWAQPKKKSKPQICFFIESNLIWSKRSLPELENFGIRYGCE
jgi:hypothetical protein